MRKEEEGPEPRFGTVNFERRRHPRFSIDLPAEYWPLDNSKNHPGRTGDISEGGLLLYLPDTIGVGQRLRVKLFFGTGPELKSIEALVQVVWKDFHLGPKDDYHRLGVKFVDISAEYMDRLKTFLNTLMSLKTPSEINIPPRLLSALGISVMKKEEGR